jgi:hypothetical protein
VDKARAASSTYASLFHSGAESRRPEDLFVRSGSSVYTVHRV